MHADKAELRRTMRRKLAASEDHPSRLAIVDQLYRVPEWVNAEIVMLYESLPDELQTASLDREMRSRGRAVAYPRVDSIDPAVMVAVQTHSAAADGWRVGTFGMREPPGEAIDPATIDFVLVPGLAFSRNGHRLGRGQGFFDRFLASLRLDCFKCGICFDSQVVDEVPTEAHDVLLDAIVTPTQVYRRTGVAGVDERR